MSSRRTRHLRWELPPDDRGPERLGFVYGLLASPRDRVAHLLHIAAEVEHALAVQYLYAAYSLGSSQPDDQAHALVQTWRHTILDIARQEMGHLATVQNLLLAIGCPLTFEREDFPAPTQLYPFPFELRRLTKRLLGKYVLCEMPGRSVIEQEGLDQEMRDIADYVGVGYTTVVNRVGHIYDLIGHLIDPSTAAAEIPPEPASATVSGTPPEPASATVSGSPAGAGDPGHAPMLGDSDFQADSMPFQVRPDEWRLGHGNLIVMTATDRASAAAATLAIADQGEGTNLVDLNSSHFGRFLEIYRAFPDDPAWRPARRVASNPTTYHNAAARRQIIHPVARMWAGLFNLRYRMLLMFLSHSFRIEAPRDASRTPRGLLISWAFGEMYNLRSIADILMDLPMRDGAALRAGPPFEMPYSLALPIDDPDCWRLHRDLLRASQLHVDKLLRETDGSHDRYLQGLSSANARALQQLEVVIGG